MYFILNTLVYKLTYHISTWEKIFPLLFTCLQTEQAYFLIKGSHGDQISLYSLACLFKH